ncbi:MAG: anhydro-N-acetylmuramic acid kinase [Alphaproteobacteria bacterium]
MTDFINSLGLMSGTSCDGIDLSVITTDGICIKENLVNMSYSYTDTEKEIIKSAYGKNPDTDILKQATDIITNTHCDLIEKFLNDDNIKIDIIGFHGQTTFHDPQNKITTQIGDAQIIANKFNIPVVADFRTADVMNGGNGAPLIPIYHSAIAKSQKLDNVCFLNLGGIANITVCTGDELIAFDTGTANCLLDDYCQGILNIPYDKNGELAKSGNINKELLNKLLSHPYFEKPFPKSLDRDEFKIDFKQAPWADLNDNDTLATLVEFSVQSIAMAINQTNKDINKIIVCGGGANNDYMLNRLREITNVELITTQSIGLNHDYIEAGGFAFLGVRHLNNLPNSFPSTTGVNAPTVGGVLFKPKS